MNNYNVLGFIYDIFKVIATCDQSVTKSVPSDEEDLTSDEMALINYYLMQDN